MDYCIPGNVLKISRSTVCFLPFFYITDVMYGFHQQKGMNVTVNADVLDSMLKNLSGLCIL